MLKNIKLNKKTMIIIGVIVVAIIIAVVLYRRKKNMAKGGGARQVGGAIPHPQFQGSNTHQQDDDMPQVVGKVIYAKESSDTTIYKSPNTDSDKIGSISSGEKIGKVEDVVMGDDDDKLYYVVFVMSGDEKTKGFVREDNATIK